MNQSALNLGDESLSHQISQQYNMKDLRRISAIARREIVDDNQDVKTYLEEMKSAGIKSPKKKEEQQVKITEENEDDQSDSSMNSSSLPRKSAISDLTAKSGSPNTGGIFP